MKIVFSEQADSDLMGILRFLAERNRPAAMALANLFDAKIESLARFPFIGRERSFLGVGVRSLVAENYAIFYRVMRESIMIVRILDGRRDIDAEFER